MNYFICPACGGMLRSAAANCQNCKTFVTKHSSTGVAQLSQSLQPHAVALKADPLKAEKMILRLQCGDAALNSAPQTNEVAQFQPALDYVEALSIPSIQNYSSDEPPATYGEKNDAEAASDPSDFPWQDSTLQMGQSSASHKALSLPHEQQTRQNSDLGAAAIGGAAAGLTAGLLLSQMSKHSKNLEETKQIVAENQNQELPANTSSREELKQLLLQAENQVSTQRRDFFADAVLTQGVQIVEQKFADASEQVNAFKILSDNKIAPASPASDTSSERMQAQLSDEQRCELIQRLVDANSNGSNSTSEFFEENRAVKPQSRSKRSSAPRPVAPSVEKTQSINLLNWISNFSRAALITICSIIVLSAVTIAYLLIGSAQIAGTSVASSFRDGRYLTTFQDASGKTNSGQMELHRVGDLIKGSGKDLLSVPSAAGQRYRNYELSGACASKGITLIKRYLAEPSSPPRQAIILEGIWTDSSQKSIAGSWHIQSNASSASGRWNARFVDKQAPSSLKWGAWRNKQNPAVAEPVDQSSNEDFFKKYIWNENEPLPSRFAKLLGICILLGVGLVNVSARFFGLHGLLNTWERERYVPISLRPQQRKVMKELGRGRVKGSLLMGTRMDWHIGELFLPRKLYLTNDRRNRNPHFLAIGNSAKGKTRLLASMALKDIKDEQKAVVVVDSEGSLCDLLLRTLAASPDAKKLLSRVRVIEPCRSESTLGFNPFLYSDCDNLLSLANSIVLGFKAVYTETQNQQNQWSQQTANILRNSVLLLILNGKNLEDLPQLLSDNDFRDVLLEFVEQNYSSEWKTLIDAWSNYKKLARTDQWLNWIEPILNRIQPLLSDRRISRLLNVSANSVDLEQVLTEKQVLILRVPEGQLEKGGSLLGSLIITGLKQAALTRFERGRDEASPCAVYVDELNSFMDAESFDSFCADSRKLKVGLHATLKTLHDLPEDFRTKIQVDFGSIAVFAISKKDADVLGPGIFKVDGRSITKVRPADLLNPFNSAPNMRMASDEEKMNTNRFVGQDEKTFFFHIMGTEAGIFRMTAPEFSDIPRGDINWDLLESIYDDDSRD